jgi:hypothetical protein
MGRTDKHDTLCDDRKSKGGRNEMVKGRTHKKIGTRVHLGSRWGAVEGPSKVGASTIRQ